VVSAATMRSRTTRRPAARPRSRPTPRSRLRRTTWTSRCLAQGRHCHSTLSLPVIDCRSLGIYIRILLLLLSFFAKMTVPGYQGVGRARGGPAAAAAGRRAGDAARVRRASGVRAGRLRRGDGRVRRAELALPARGRRPAEPAEAAADHSRGAPADRTPAPLVHGGPRTEGDANCRVRRMPTGRPPPRACYRRRPAAPRRHRWPGTR
jgi:hypothetical protein